MLAVILLYIAAEYFYITLFSFDMIIVL